jgi:peptidoglycan/xylan/chitin deacetylase (PgdA/CDA1 family)
MSNDGSDRITILTYHSLDTSGSVVSVAPGLFADQMRCLADLGVRGVTLREVVAHRAATGSWPAQRVVLTFDDGYANFADLAWPVLLRHGFTATLFLISGYVGGWNDWAAPPAGFGRRAMLSWEQVAALAAGGVEIAAHTRTHRNLPSLSADDADDEIVGARHDIEHHLQQPVDSFAYPFGRLNAATEAIVRRGFQAACTTELRRAHDEAATRLPRVDAYYLSSPDALRRLLDGRLDRYLTLRRWGRVLREAAMRSR